MDHFLSDKLPTRLLITLVSLILYPGSLRYSAYYLNQEHGNQNNAQQAPLRSVLNSFAD